MKNSNSGTQSWHRNIAFASIVVSVISVTTAILCFPLCMYYIQYLESDVQQHLALCNFDSVPRYVGSLDNAQNDRSSNGLQRFRRAIQIFKSTPWLDGGGSEFLDPLQASWKNEIARDDVVPPPGKEAHSGSSGITARAIDRCCTCNRGPVGPPGAPGADGANGTPGEPGQPGDRGDQGIWDKSQLLPRRNQCPCVAPPGDPGPHGVAGRPGETGESGTPGQDGRPGDQGPRGAPGETGRTGPVGTPGPRGDAGKSLTMQGNPGPMGDPGRPGLPGAPGAPGSSGNLGKVGKTGEPGLEGRQGAQGRPGPQGSAGCDGTQGDAGSCAHCSPPRLAPGY